MNALKSWKEVIAMVGIMFSAWFFVDERYVHADVGAKTHIEIRKDMITSELRQLSAKEKTQGLELWEKLRKEDLERQLKEMTK